MQSVYETIFKIACKELPYKRMVLGNSESIMYRGFKISKEKERYYWQDTRYNNYYEPVDPLITKNILEEGFLKTLTQVRIYNNKEKIYQIDQEISEIEKSVLYWIERSNKNWEILKKTKINVLSNPKLKPKQKETILNNLCRKYDREKALFIKKRRVLRVEREGLKTEKIFYLSQIQIYKNQNYGN